MLRLHIVAVMLVTVTAMFSPATHAHVSLAQKTATADVTQVFTFTVGHGCEGADTMKVVVDIPAGVRSIRPIPSDFDAVVHKNGDGTVTAIEFAKPVDKVRDADDAFYQLQIRFRPPAAPVTTLAFDVHQTCRATDGTESNADWVGDDAATLTLLPARLPGWNAYTVPAAVADNAALTSLFADALIVWKGNAAWSVNPNTIAQIEATDGATVLTALAAGDEIWVRY